MTSEQASYPWGSGQPDANTVYLLPIDVIAVPDLRVTSTFNPEQYEELKESLKTEGQKDPIKLIWAAGAVILSDGLNRILALKDIGVTTIKALIQVGNIKDVQIANIITARQRGKENPAQTAEVIQDLLQNEKMDPAEVKRRLGLGSSTFTRLLKISSLPSEVKDLIKYGRLGVMAAYHIAHLENSAQAIALANQAAGWGYTEDQVKAAVQGILNPDIDGSTQQYIFEADGRPQIVYPKCSGCNEELKSFTIPFQCCEQCAEAVKAFFAQYFAPLPSPSPSASPPPSPAAT